MGSLEVLSGSGWGRRGLLAWHSALAAEKEITQPAVSAWEHPLQPVAQHEDGVDQTEGDAGTHQQQRSVVQTGAGTGEGDIGSWDGLFEEEYCHLSITDLTPI